MTPFVPRGDRARWRILYDILLAKAIDAVITYKEMGEALDLDPEADRHPIQMALRRAAKEYERENLRALEAVPNEGYRIVEPHEHLRLAHGQQERSKRALVAGRSKVVNVDLSGLDPEARKAFDVTAQAFSLLLDYSRRLDVRQRRLEDAVAGMAERHDRSDAEIAELKARLARLEGGEDEPG